ncbi:MAG: alpha/beta hydrolase-fold protein [Pseudomonadota bacterium]
MKVFLGCAACAALIVLVSSWVPPSDVGTVTVHPEPLAMPELDRDRTIRIYLPPGYDTSDRRYPVLYMHDGQNLFDDATAYAGEWGVDEILDELARTDGLELIVVGVDNGGEHRMLELNPWDHPEFGPGEGDAYLAFVTDVVKPWVDARFRTQPAADATGIMGSSMGGLISHYAAFQHADRFTRIGVFSPSLWIADEAFETTVADLSACARLYYLVGRAEGGSMADDTERLGKQLRDEGLTAERLTVRVAPDGEHNEAFWRRELPAALRWLFVEGTKECLS